MGVGVRSRAGFGPERTHEVWPKVTFGARICPCVCKRGACPQGPTFNPGAFASARADGSMEPSESRATHIIWRGLVG